MPESVISASPYYRVFIQKSNCTPESAWSSLRPAGEQPAKARRRVQRVGIRENLRTGNALIRAADLHAEARKRIDGQRFHLRQQVRALAAVRRAQTGWQQWRSADQRDLRLWNLRHHVAQIDRGASCAEANSGKTSAHAGTTRTRTIKCRIRHRLSTRHAQSASRAVRPKSRPDPRQY